MQPQPPMLREGDFARGMSAIAGNADASFTQGVRDGHAGEATVSRHRDVRRGTGKDPDRRRPRRFRHRTAP
jgi:hypothetical protein